MSDNLPGTIINKEKRASQLRDQNFLESIFSITSGLTLSQVMDITGIDSPAIHNWIRRGWVPHPINKRYTQNHLSRILIINLLRNILPLEKISFIVHYINGDTDDLGDDIIDEATLYSYICKMDNVCEQIDISDEKAVTYLLDTTLADYCEKYEGCRLKLFKALKIVLFASYASRIKNKALDMIEAIMQQEGDPTIVK